MRLLQQGGKGSKQNRRSDTASVIGDETAAVEYDPEKIHCLK